MKVVYYPKQISKKPTTLILGSFASIHNGHVKLIKTAIKKRRAVTVMIIDDPSKLPKISLNNETNENITDLNTRLQQLANLNVDNVIVIKVNAKLLNTQGEEFIDNIIKSTNAKHLVMGKDFKAGKGGAYTSNEISKKYDSTVVELEKINDKKIGTGLMKEYIEFGKVEDLLEISPFPWQIEVDFNSMYASKKLSTITPQAGIYAGTIEINDIGYWCSIHVDQNKQITIHAPDLLIKNKPFSGRLSFYKLIRAIISSRADEITEKDKKLVASYLLVL